MSETLSVLIVGVGGQGVITASEIVSEVVLNSGYDIKKSEIHGMSQRGGSVSSHIRFSKEKVYSPVAPKGSVDFMLSFEKMEGLRWIDHIKKDAVAIINDYRWDPLPVSSGKIEYTPEVNEKIKARRKAIIYKATDLAAEIGNIRVTNIVLLGTLAKLLPIEKEKWLEVIKKKVPPKTIDLNIKAFEEGYKKES
ncbi:indolepyruvate oxidoreductase subunit beta [Candidatus Dependentiae bacterium]|nr:indolepyruvate oxidoreductase subunit beta [Candidatus Dependentiae bacterium]